MPGKRAHVVAPGPRAQKKAAAASASLIDTRLVAEVAALLRSGQATPEALAVIRERNPVAFDVSYAGLMDELARADIHWFAARVIKDQKGEFIVPRPLDHLIQSHIDECKRDGKYAGILAPIGSGKTAQVSLVRVLWQLKDDPNAVIKIVSVDDASAVKRLKQLSQVIMYDPDFKRIAGDIVYPSEALARSQEPWNAHQITIARSGLSPEPSVQAHGILTSITGARASLLIFDDPIDQKVLFSEAYKRTIHEKLHNEWLGRKWIGDHHIIWICTRWAEDDESAVLMRNPNWRFLIIRVADDFAQLDTELVEQEQVIARGSCPLPRGWTPEMLRSEQISMGEVPFARAYKQRAHSVLDRTFKHLERCFDEHLTFDAAAERAMREHWICYVGVDISGQSRPGNAIVVVGIDPNDKLVKRHLVNVRAGKWGSVELAAQLDDVARRFNPVVVRVENNSVQELFHGWIRSEPEKHPWARKLEPFTTTARAKWDLETGLMTMDLDFQSNAWVIPAAQMTAHEFGSGDHVLRCAECRFIREVRDHPTYPTNDVLMALWIARSGVEAHDVRAQRLVEDLVKQTPQDDFYTRNPIAW